MQASRFLTVALITLWAAVLAAPTTAPWGADGHQIVGHVAAELLPPDMPAFFREAGPQLTYLNPEPDRWRSRTERRLDPAMDAAHAPEHYINFELIPPHYLDARSRLAYLDSLHSADLPNAGLLPFRMIELSQRLRVAFRQWREADDADIRRFIEQRILNDAGILGHYVGDGANPHHTSIHHNGWADGYANPREFTTDNSFHRRFESVFVGHNISTDRVRQAATAEARVFPDMRSSIIDFLMETHQELETLYVLEQMESFGEETRSAAHHDFAAARLARGAEMLRDLWYTAWATSEEAEETR